MLPAILALGLVLQTPAAVPPEIEQGFQCLYRLQFELARQQFQSYLQAQPDAPMGHLAMAASYLFEEFYRQGVLRSEFFLDDRRLLGGIEGRADPARTAAFLEALSRARAAAARRLRSGQDMAEALYVETLADGLEADYQALLARRTFAAVRLLRKAEREASALLRLRPEGDAYVALGAAHYIIGCLPGYKRALLWLGGVTGDRSRGIAELERAAREGHLLRPYARSLLALVYLREHRPEAARMLFEQLHRQFPENPIFAAELARLLPR